MPTTRHNGNGKEGCVAGRQRCGKGKGKGRVGLGNGGVVGVVGRGSRMECMLLLNESASPKFPL